MMMGEDIFMRVGGGRRRMKGKKGKGKGMIWLWCFRR
jgi:hypothetical protein